MSQYYHTKARSVSTSNVYRTQYVLADNRAHALELLEEDYSGFNLDAPVTVQYDDLADYTLLS